MASLHRQKGDRPGFKVRWRDPNGETRVLWLGKMSQRSADTMFRNLRELIRANAAKVRPDGPAEAWAFSLTGRIRKRLAELGLVAGEQKRRSEDSGRFLGPFVDDYIAQRTDAKPSTVTNFKHAKRWLVNHFGDNKLLAEITSADCDRFKRFMESELATSTSDKIIKRCKTMMTHAVRDRLIDKSPFDDVKVTGGVNRNRDHFVSYKTFETVLGQCPDHDWRMVLAFARLAGMRRCEITTIKWSDVLWDKNRLRIDSPKTGLRFCPLFPELRPIVEKAFDYAVEGSTYCIRFRQGQNLGTQFNRVVESAGIESWPKTFVNMRASRRTELEECYPNHVINSWLGHSKKVAEKYYLQITDDHWDLGSTKSTVGGNAGGNSSAHQDASTEISALKKPVKTGSEACGRLLITPLAPPARLELATKRLTAARSTN